MQKVTWLKMYNRESVVIKLCRCLTSQYLHMWKCKKLIYTQVQLRCRHIQLMTVEVLTLIEGELDENKDYVVYIVLLRRN